MTGFATPWLDLREPADLRARDAGLLAKAADAAMQSAAGAVVDLGCGTGATVRAFSLQKRTAPLPSRWRLVDNDAALLAEARRRCSEIAAVEILEADLAGLDPALFADAALVTASALFDLASLQFVEALADRLTEKRVGLYAALNYDGKIAWANPDGLDEAVVAAFNLHQRRDKGFGAALGPEAGGALATAFAQRGYRVQQASSPWILGAGDQELQGAFVAGLADAAEETGQIVRADLDRWRMSRLDAASRGSVCRVGHGDLLALPPSA